VKKVFLLLLVLGLACMIGACKTDEGIVIAEEEEPAPSYQIIGVQDADSIDFLMTNSTGLVIVEIAIKDATAPAYPGGLMGSSALIEVDETVQVYYTPTLETAQEAIDMTEAPDEEERVFNVLYDILVTFEDGSTMEVWAIDLDALDDFAIRYGEDVLYIEYVDATTGEKVSTEDAARAHRAMLVAEAEAAVEAEANAAKKSNSRSSGTGNTGAPSSGGSASQAADECFGDNAPAVNF